MGERLTVRLVGGGPWGFRLQGGGGIPLTVSKIRRRSKAQHHLLENDRILSINGVTCQPLNYDQAMAIVDSADNTLNIDIIRGGPSGKENRDPSATWQQPKEAVKEQAARDVATKQVISTQQTTVKTKIAPETAPKSSGSFDNAGFRSEEVPKPHEPTTQAAPSGPPPGQPKPTAKASGVWSPETAKPEPIPEMQGPVTSSPEPTSQLPLFSPELANLAPELAALDAELALALKPASQIKYAVPALETKPKSLEPTQMSPKPAKLEPSQISPELVPDGSAEAQHLQTLANLAPELAALAPELAALDTELMAMGSSPISSLARVPQQQPKDSQRQAEVSSEATSDGHRYQSAVTEKSSWSDCPQHQASSFLQKKELVEVSGGGQGAQQVASVQKETKSQEVFRETKIEKRSTTFSGSQTNNQLSPEDLKDDLSWRPTSPIFQKPLLPPSQSPVPPAAAVNPSPTPRPFAPSQTPYTALPTPYASSQAPYVASQMPFTITKAPVKEDVPAPAVWSPPSQSGTLERKKKVPPPTPPKPSRQDGPPQVLRPISAPPRDFDIYDLYDSDQPYQASSTRTSKSSRLTDLRSSHSTAVSDSEDWQHSRHHFDPYSSEEEMGSSSLFTRRKKMFSSSSFYEEPHCIYPTVEEQVVLARKIAGSLSNDNNKKSKGANMFFKRVKRSHTWIHEGPDPYSDGGTTDTDMEPTTPDTGPSPNYIKVSAGPPKLKLILDPRQLQDLVKLRSSGQNPVEHTAVSPDICMDLVRDLNSPRGKGAALFAKRKQKAEEWVVDDARVRKQVAQNKADAIHLLEESCLPFAPAVVQNRLKLIKSPWEAALESPIGSCDAAFVELPPVTSSVAQSIIKAAENKARIAPAAATYTESLYIPQPDVYRPKAPRGWMGSATGSVPSIYSDPTSLPPLAQEAPAGGLRFRGSTAPPGPPRPLSFHDFNTIPRSWTQVAQQSQGQHGFKSVRAPK